MKKKPNLQHLRIFECPTLVKRYPPYGGQKFDSKAWNGILVGYESEGDIYRKCVPELKKIIISRDVIFYENVYLTSPLVFLNMNEQYNNGKEIQISDAMDEEEDISSSSSGQLQTIRKEFVPFPSTEVQN